ncbi:MAG: hypothetical protein CSA76_02895 [Spirochaetales bacterium]|nr:MAG: hypothetical protein CSA76_02895 [Spirochaetales bacterium]
MPQPGKTNLNLSPHVILTDSGVSFFMQKGYKLSKIPTAEGAQQYGVKLAQVSPSSFQHMLRIGYLSRLELSRPEFTSVRSDLMDFSKLIFFGMLYHHYDQVVFDMLINSSIIKEWNRANPGNIIDSQTRINDLFLQEVLSRNAGQIKSIRKAITAPLIERVGNNSSLQADEINNMIFMTEKFMDFLRPFNWFMLSRFSSYEGHRQLIQETSNMLDLYIRRAVIADYLTLLLMELAISAETLNIISFAKKNLGESVDARALLFDPARRDALVEALKKAGADLTIAWSIRNAALSVPGSGKKLELIIYNREAAYHELKEKVEEKMKSGKGVSLSQFYKSTAAGNSEMGLLYLGYLQEECNKVGIRFTSHVGESKGDVPSLSVTLQF